MLAANEFKKYDCRHSAFGDGKNQIQSLEIKPAPWNLHPAAPVYILQ